MTKTMKKKQTKILIFGTFDRLHKGHIYFIQKAKDVVKEGELYVLVAKDENVERIKKKLPADNELARMMNVYLLGIAKKVILGEKNKEDFFKVIKIINPDIICLGYDQNEQGLNNYLKKSNLKIKIIRIDALEPEKYKSSKL